MLLKQFYARHRSLVRKSLLWIQAAILAVAGLLPLLNSPAASAAQLSGRKITISSSKLSQTSVTYSVSFTVNQTTLIKGIVVDICQDSPLIGPVCTRTNGVSATPTTGTVTVSNTGGSPASVAFNVNAASSSSGKLILTHATGFTPVTSAPVTFSFTATNPTGTLANNGTPGTFYGRLLTYTSDTVAAAYDSSTTGANNPGVHIDEGGVALSTANQLTVNAKVQEQLTFCVGNTSVNDATTNPGTCGLGGASITGTTGSTVDLGVVDNAAVYTSPVSTASNGNALNGAALVRTNANSGVTVSYFAEQATSGSNHLGALRVSGATCTADSTPSTSLVDQCFNSAGTTQGTFTAGTEKFGMTIGGTNCGAVSAYSCTYTSGNENLKPSTNYLGQGTSGSPVYGVGNGFAWDERGASTGTTQIASSSTVVDNEALILRFAATASATTPTGFYGVDSTYIATATF